MEATHVLLGRPWQYDRKVFHDGFTNKLSFDFHGHKVTLKSLSKRSPRGPNHYEEKEGG